MRRLTKLASKNVKLADAITQIQIWLVIALAYFAFSYWMLNLKGELKEIKANATETNATLEAIREKIGEEAWQRNEQRLKQSLQNQK